MVLAGGDVSDTIDVVNNVFYKNNTNVAYFLTWWGDVGRNNFTSRWYNNVIDNNYNAGTQSTNSEISWSAGANDSKPSNYIFKNNLLGDSLKLETRTNYQTRITLDFDTASNLVGKANFTDTAARNFSLLETSPGIGAGLASLAPATDYLGLDRPSPSGSVVDIGAIESSSSIPTPSISSVANAKISGKNSIKLTYSVVNRPAVDSVIIYRGTVNTSVSILSSPLDTIGFSTTNSPIFIDTNAILVNTTYYYIIKSKNSSTGSLSNKSAIKSITTPTSTSTVSVPTGLAVTQNGRQGLVLNWTLSAGTPFTYVDIYRGTSIANATLLKSIKDTARTYADSTTLPLTSYTYYLINRDQNDVVSDTSSSVVKTAASAGDPVKWYVDATAGSNTAGSNTSSTPYKTLKFTFTKVFKGDTVILKPGSYNEKFNFVPGAIIGSNYLIDKTDTAAISSTIIDATGLKGVIASFKNNTGCCDVLRTKFIGLTFSGQSGATNMFNYSWGNSNQFITIDHCLLTNNGNQTYTSDQYDDYSRFMVLGDSAVISNSTFINNHGKIRLEGTNISITKNTFVNNNNGIVRINNGVELPMFEGWNNGGNKIIITDNIFANNGTFKGTNEGPYYRDNIFRFEGNDSLFLANNTFYKNFVPVISFYNQSLNEYVVNNIFYKNERDLWVNNNSSNYGDVYLFNNFFTKDLLTTGELDKLNVTASNNIIANNPYFLDSTTFTLTSSSSLINAGVNIYGKGDSRTVSSTDIYGTPRPSPTGTKSDIGAVESLYGFPSPYLTTLDGSDKQVVIKWTKPANGAIAGYKIYRSTSAIADDANPTAIITINKIDSLLVLDSANLTNLTKYYYRVKAFNSASPALYSGFSNQLSVQPNVPPDGVDTVSAYAGARSVVLAWSDTSVVRRKYNIYRGLDTKNLDKIASAIDTTYYIDNTVVANTKYFYGIKVIDSVGAASVISKLAYAIPNNIWVIDTAGKIDALGKSIGNGSINSPLKSIQYAIDNSQYGDTILLNDGTYKENLTVYTKAIVLKAKNIGKAIITPSSSASQSTLNIQDNNPWNLSDYPKAKNKFIGLTFTGNASNGWPSIDVPSVISVSSNSNPVFESCNFTNNTSTYVFAFDRSAASFINCLITNNTTPGGIFNNGYQDTTQARTNVPRFINCVFDNNGFFNRNCCGQEGATVIFNSIISNNGYDNNFNAKLFKVINSIVDNNKFADQYVTNQLVDPKFKNIASGDYSLTNFSPALGLGLDKYIIGSAGGYDTLKAISYDFNYASRPNPTGTKIDLGAFENKYSVAAPQISRLQKTGTAVVLTWNKTGTTTLSNVKLYRDTIKTALDTLVAPMNRTIDLTKDTIEDVLPSAGKEYFYALRATVGTGNAAVNTGLSNIKSSKDTIFVPALHFIADTASLNIRAASRSGGSLQQSVNLVKLAADAATALPKLILYSQAYRQIDSTKRFINDSLTAINILAGTGSNKIKLALNKKSLIAKGKNDYMQVVGAMNVNGDNEFDLVGIYRNSNDMNQANHIAYLTNNNLNFTLDTVSPTRSFFNPNVNAQDQTTNLAYKWDQRTFQYQDNQTNQGNNIESAAEFMDGNFDGKEELVVSLNQVKWEPNPTLNFGNNWNPIQQINSSIRIIKTVDINNDGIPDIFGLSSNPWQLGLSGVNGTPIVVFVSNKKDGKFYLYLTGINVDWGAGLYFGDFKNSRTVQILTRQNGGNYKVYDFDNTFGAVSAEMQVNGSINDGKVTVGDLNNDGYPDVVTIDNSGSFIAYLNNHRGDFDKTPIGAGAAPFATNNNWAITNLRMLDLNQDGAKDLMWFEPLQEQDGSLDSWNTNNYVLRIWMQETTGGIARTAPAAIAATDITASNSGYKVKIKWTPSADAVDPYIFANLIVDTNADYSTARINNAYNYRKLTPTVPIVLDRAYARNYPDSIQFNDLGISSKKPYYIKIQMVNKEGQASTFAEKTFIPKDPLELLEHNIPGLFGARFVWGDYNNDGLLDLAVMGENDNGNITAIYKNTGSTFENQNLTNKAYHYGDIKWVDLNNDGWLDIAMIGQPGGSGVGFQTLINNHGVFEINTPTSVDGLKRANMAFGDYDNNGTLDMFTSGQDAQGIAHSYLYTNDGRGNFTKVSDFNGAIPDMYDADARFIDYDLDGDLDLVFAGTGTVNGKVGAIGGVRVNTLLDPKISNNNYGGGNYNNGYTYPLSSNMWDPVCNCNNNYSISMKNARFDVGDIDGDGDLDIVEIGTFVKSVNNTNTDVPLLLIIRNQTMETKNAKFGNYFSYGSIYNISGVPLDNISDGDVKLVDINNDGLLDITVAGLDSSANPVTKFYLNQGGFGNFTLSQNKNIPQYSNAAISWGDADGDGSMDLVISGQKLLSTTTSIYLNKQGDNINTAPTTPKNLTFIDQGQGRVLLQWDASDDDHTSPNNMYYNLKLGTKPGLSDLRVIQVNPKTDKLQTPNTSLIGSNRYYIELPPGVYYWSVQAVDGNFLSSTFADNQKIVLKYPWQFVNQGGLIDARIIPLENSAFAWADVDNKGVFDFLYLGTGNATNDQWNTPLGLYKNLGGKFAKFRNDSTMPATLAGKGTGFRNDLNNISNAQIKWVDINNDGLLDLIVAGDDITNNRGRLAVFKNLSNYKFENITNNVYNGEQLAKPKIEFVDLDNNGFKDFIYTGEDITGAGVVKFLGFYKDTVAKTNSGLLGFNVKPISNNLDSLLTSKVITNVSLAIGDLNKDLKPDIAILYNDGSNNRRVGAVYMNTSDTSNKISFVLNETLALPTLRNATIDLIDYNNDGLLDLALSGRSDAGVIFRIYQSKWLDTAAKTIQLVKTESDVKPFEKGQTTWGDIDNDGYPDVIFSGTRPGTGVFSAMALADPSYLSTTGIMKYNELPTFPFGNYSVMRPSLGDFSGKRVLDLVLVGTEKVRDPLQGTTSIVNSFKILKNVRDLSSRINDSSVKTTNASVSTGKIKSLSIGSGTTNATLMIKSNSVRGFADSTIAVADSNYIEDTYGANKAPTAPKMGNSVIVSKVAESYLVKLNWSAASDDNTPASGLTYAVAIGTKPGKTDILEPNASLTTGKRKTPEAGNAGKNISLTVLLKPGTYYWASQSIDASNTGSKFSGNKVIQVNGDRTLVEKNAPYDILLNASAEASYFLKQNDSTGVKFVLTALDNDSTAKLTYSVVTDTANLFTIDAASNTMRLAKKPTSASYGIKLKVADAGGLYYEKLYTFQAIQAPSKLLVNGKDSSYFYYNTSAADSAKFTLALNASYSPVPTVAPVLTYQFVTGAGGENNDLFDLGSTILVNKRKLNDADTLKLRVAAIDEYGLSVERFIFLINKGCAIKPSLSVKSTATACLPVSVNLKDSLITNGSGKGLTFSYYSDINTTTKVTDPTNIVTSGTYYIKALDTAGCGTSKPIVVSVAQLPAAPTITSATACQNQTDITVGYTAPSSKIKLVWYAAETGGTPSTATPKINTSAIGTVSYYVGQGDTAAGCYGDRVKVDIVVKATPAAPSISRDTAGKLVASVATGVKWYKDTTLVSSAASFKPASAGSYTVKATEDGCTSVASNAYYFMVTDVINLSSTEYIKLAPNPFVNYLNFDFVVNGYQKLNIDVFATSNGARVSSKQGVYAGSRLSYSELSAGVYIFKVTSSDGKLSYQFKMIKL